MEHPMKNIPSITTIIFLLSNKKFNLGGLSSTQESLKLHLFRTFHQVQTWFGREINAQHWVWKLTINGLQPVFTNDKPSSKSIL